MIFPSSLLLKLLLFLIIPTALMTWLQVGGDVWLFCASLAGGCCVVDLLLGLRRPQLRISRKVPGNLPVTAWSPVELLIKNDDSRSHSLLLHDHYDPNFSVRDAQQAVVLQKKTAATVTYQVYPQKRGPALFSHTEIITASPFALWQKRWIFRHEDRVRVFPNFRKVANYTILARAENLSLLGIHKTMRRGEGNEFQQLREYREGDSLQKIDWKATSRLRKFISRDYEDERDQQIVFLVDTGRRMIHEGDGIRHLDQVLNSILLLAFVAARQGDAAGMFCFGGTRKWYPPRREAGALRGLLLHMYDIEARPVASDYTRATEDILALQKRRAMMVIAANSRAEDYEEIGTMAEILGRKHLVVVADLKEEIFETTLRQPVGNFPDALTHQALRTMLNRRKRFLTRLRSRNIEVLDVTPKQLPGVLVSRYLEIKSKGRL